MYSFITNCALFLSTGILTTLFQQLIAYQGGSHPATLFPTFCVAIAMALVGYAKFLNAFKKNQSLPLLKQNLPEDEDHPKDETLSLNPKTSPQSRKTVARIVLLTIIDLSGNVTTIIGLVYSGSGIYQVVYSSVIVFAGVLAEKFLHKKLTKFQWIGIGLIIFGLFFSVVFSGSNTGSNSTVLFGIFMTLISAFLYAISYTFSEYLITSEQVSSPFELCSYMGKISSLLVTLYIFVVVMPNWGNLVSEPIEKKVGNPYLIFVTYLLLIFGAFFHNISYFSILETNGSVIIGIMQAIRAVLVFIFSSFFYCGIQSSQCYTFAKFFATLFVFFGTITYSAGETIYSKFIHSEI
ncbi:hypothetical protein M0811_01686 [Anaeramoeba ignava]|uniref:EamA domain-containing protein n=1 Tax=Anaeramoeba ignava TaxID=1746090 RepID=A0A9Q0R8H0_ANAIG|nr:hypothetical protein M0811_01686 [Anaeramoeba ignava]|eukprot:Anaeramoba_ignava/a224444_12.p1 GENE.a224444_12~~a224444_12.p1  ORF type:complete len:351 (-),score=84.75 a224444_12:25-1077(-)